MSGWGRNGTGNSGQKVTGAGYDFSGPSSSGSSASGGVYHGGAGSAGPNSQIEAANVGRISANLLAPDESAQEASEGIGGLFNGLRQQLFGGNENDEFGEASRRDSALGGIPILGDLGRGASDLIGGGGELLGGAINAVGGGLERLPNPIDPISGAQGKLNEAMKDPGLQAWLDQPSTSDPEKTNREVFKGDKGILDTGLLGTESHYQSVAVREYEKFKALKNPTFQPGAFTAPGSVADLVTELFDLIGTPGNAYNYGLARVKDRAAEVETVGDITEAGGKVVNTGFLGTGLLGGGDYELNPIEQLAYAKIKDGSWTHDQANDFLVTNGATSHDAAMTIALAVATPDTALSFGGALAARAGVKGAELAKTLDTASDAVRVAEEAVQAARVAAETAKGARKIKAAQKVLDAALDQQDVARKTYDALDSAPSIVKVFGRTYQGLAGSNIGKAAKVTRYLIDPLHGIDLKSPNVSRAVDLTSDAIPRTIADTTGVHHYKGVLDELLKDDHTGTLAGKFAEDFGVASTNFGREQLVDMFIATQMNAGLGEELVAKNVDELFDLAYQSTKERDLVRQVREATVKNIIQQHWTPADIQTTARVLGKVYPEKSAELWEAYLKGASVEQRSLLKFAGYGRLNKELLNWTADAASKGIKVGANQFEPSRMVLLAKGTFTRVAGEDLLAQIKALGTKKGSRQKQAALIREYQERYKSLRYVTISESNPGRSIDRFVEWLSDGLERLPMQATNKELDELEGVADIRDVLGDAYSLGFRPADEYLHGIERANGTGLYVRSGTTWVDHVADAAISYRPARVLDTNILGRPIPAIPGVRVAAKMVDHLDSAARIAKAQVSGSMITESARAKFIAKAQERLGEHGVNEQLATHWWEAIQRATRQMNEGSVSVSSARGLSSRGLYETLRSTDLIPQPLLNGSYRLHPSDILKLVLDSYEGDMRYVGLTQKLSGRVKNMLSFDGRINYASQIAEVAWPTLKFRYNPIFQLQEKVEPWVLNAQRGVAFARNADLTKEDQALEALLQTMTNNSLVRQADLDQFEYSARVLFGKSMERIAATPNSRFGRITNSLGGKLFGDIQGMKRVNMLRTFKKGLGREVKSAYRDAFGSDEAWDAMKLDANLRAGKVISDDDFAVSLMAQNQLANDIAVTRLKGVLGKEGLTADWSNAIKTGQWSVPTTLGELRSLDLEHMAKSLQFVRKSGPRTGDPIEDLSTLREALANKEVTLDQVADALNVMGADQDYIKRVTNALDFHWNGFWKQAEARFGLTPDESRALQDMIAGSARLRDMTPVDFMSQVWSPYIENGAEGALGSLDGHLTILREARQAGRKIKAREAKLKESRSTFAATEASTSDDFVRQLSKAFSAHLDPSAKRALLLEFRPELRKLMREKKVQFDMSELSALWDDEAEGQLADRILGYMKGVEPTGAYDGVDDVARGVEAVRTGADDYMKQRGVTPLATRRYFKPDEVLSEDTARAYSALPSTEFERTGRKPTIRQIEKADTELKPRPADVDERTYQAYQDMVVETRAQWDHMTKPKSKGGMGIKVVVARGDPYPNSAAMRADVAKGRIRVFAGDSDHPLMTNEQNVMFRAVHDVFGHAAEGFEFGPRGELNAAIKHSSMYSDTGRAAMLTETHGQNSWVNFSDDVIPDVPQRPLPTTVEEFEAEFPFEKPESFGPDEPFTSDIIGETNYGTEELLQLEVQERVGDGIRGLPAEQQEFILSRVARLQRRFPEHKVYHIDVPDNLHVPADEGGMGMAPGVKGVTWGSDQGESVVLLSPDWYGPDFDPTSAAEIQRNMAFGQADMKRGKGLDADGKEFYVPRQSNRGVPWSAAGGGIEHTIYHEMGHVIDSRLRPEFSWMSGVGTGGPVRLPENAAYWDFMDEFEHGEAIKQLSEYAFHESHDAAAELFAVANRIADDPNFPMDILQPELRQAVEDYTKLLKDMGVWVDDAPSPAAGRTVREVNKAAPGSVYAEQKAALLPQDILDRFADQFVGRGKHVESNPDVARTAQFFGKWTEGVIRNGLLKGEGAQYRGILDDIAGIPTTAAVPYNHTEAMALNLATQNMVRKWDDAFRLQYFAQERTVLERTINHPMFGLYPASYMWGKIAPELIRFIASEPFGLKTGGMLYAINDAKTSIALRREFDPEFDLLMEELGHSQAISFGGFLLPSLPWDVGASAPAWMRNIAQQGLSNQKRIAEGEEAEPLSPLDAVGSSVDQMLPYVRNAAWAGRGIGELQDLTGIGAAQPSEEDESTAQQERDEWISAAELEGPLSQVMAELRATLSR